VTVALAFAFTFAAHAADPRVLDLQRPHTTALVELYTSEGCDTCPPADHWLSSLFAQGFRPDQVVPLALHVDYWTTSAGKTRSRRGNFPRGQRRLAQMKRPAFVYTPQVLLQGRTSAAGRREVRRAGGAHQFRPARARIALTIRAVAPGAIHAELSAMLIDPSEKKNAAVYLAATRTSSRARSPPARTAQASRARFRGARMDRPDGFGENLKLERKRALPLLRGATRRTSGGRVRAERSTSDVLQALMLRFARANLNGGGSCRNTARGISVRRIVRFCPYPQRRSSSSSPGRGRGTDATARIIGACWRRSQSSR